MAGLGLGGDGMGSGYGKVGGGGGCGGLAARQAARAWGRQVLWGKGWIKQINT